MYFLGSRISSAVALNDIYLQGPLTEKASSNYLTPTTPPCLSVNVFLFVIPIKIILFIIVPFCRCVSKPKAFMVSMMPGYFKTLFD